jgi:hypothetical protein
MSLVRLNPTRRDLALFAWAPLVLTVAMGVWLSRRGQLGVDFRREYWVAGWRLLHGRDLYHWTNAQIEVGTAFPYPAATALLFAPFVLLPIWMGSLLFAGACMGCFAGSLWLLGVRDWRVYGLGFLAAPVVAGWQTSNLTLLLLLGLAIAWRWRDTPVTCGSAAALLLVLKPFAWPVAVWLLASRRYAAAAYCAVITIVVNLVTWPLVGVDELTRFLRLDTRVTDLLYRGGYGVPALAAHLGLGRTIGFLLLGIGSVALTSAIFAFGRDREWLALTGSCLLMLLASPLTWDHYFAMLIAPLAIARPRLGKEWSLLVLLWVCPAVGVTGWEVAAAWLISAALLYMLRRSEPASFIQPGVAADIEPLRPHSAPRYVAASPAPETS